VQAKKNFHVGKTIKNKKTSKIFYKTATRKHLKKIFSRGENTKKQHKKKQNTKKHIIIYIIISYKE
jgi:hypothetical protein